MLCCVNLNKLLSERNIDGVHAFAKKVILSAIGNNRLLKSTVLYIEIMEVRGYQYQLKLFA